MVIILAFKDHLVVYTMKWIIFNVLNELTRLEEKKGFVINLLSCDFIMATALQKDLENDSRKKKTVKRIGIWLLVLLSFFPPSTLKEPLLEDNKSLKTNRNFEGRNECSFLCHQQTLR